MIHKVLQTIEENHMFCKNDKVIVAVSGGPDSMCLLNTLYNLKSELHIDICAAHLNHCLRGKDADEDEEFVREFCRKKNIDFYSKRVDVNALCREKGQSCEMAGRTARYEFFEELKGKIGADKIAIAHNANDQAETILMHIMRGAGLNGLIGIRPVRDNVYVRPLIKVSRDEIEDYCRENKLNPKIDKTNFEYIYGRNKVRLDIIPYIKKNFNSDIIAALNRLSDTLSVDNKFIEDFSIKKYKIYCYESSGKVTIKKEAFLEKEAIITRIIRRAISYLAKSTYNFEKKHILDIIYMQHKSTGSILSLPRNIEAYNNYGDIILRFDNINAKDYSKEYKLELKTCNNIKEYGYKVNIKIIKKDENIDFNTNRFVKYFDYGKINEKISIRFRKNGDKFTPFGMKGTKKIKDIFIDMKISKPLRDKIPLICFDDEIAWIVGYRVSDIFKVTDETKDILEIRFEGGEDLR
ncbi:MAG: tRNA lysidine(34) synthetase TilS [Clostridium sp.]|nr:tRNA lysidine(34) synthetase TilS [Clostridium sp.]